MADSLSYQISPSELKDLLAAQSEVTILDVRELEEFALANLGGHVDRARRGPAMRRVVTRV